MVLPPLSQGDDVADDQLGHSHQTASPNTGESTEDGKLQHRLGKGGGQGADEKDGQPDKKNELARPDIRETAIKKLPDSRRSE